MRIIALAACFLLAVPSGLAYAGPSGTNAEPTWADLAHEENTVRGSLLYVPYQVLKIPLAIINGILHPTPTTRSTIPPPPHRSPR